MTVAKELNNPIERIEGKIEVTGGRVWYEAFGDLGKTNPLLIVHGGPGWPRYLNPLSEMSQNYGRPVIFYDQLGCGNSDKPADPSLWTLDRSVSELRDVMTALRDSYGADNIHLLGHSFGATVVTELASGENKNGIKSITLASPLINTDFFIRDTLALIKLLPDSEEFLRLIEKFKASADESDPEYSRYLEFVKIFEDNFVYGSASEHPAVLEAEAMYSDEVYTEMWGSQEFVATGNLAGLDLVPNLTRISVPTLFTGGAFDEVRPDSLTDFSNKTPNSRLIIYKNSAHMPHLEEGQKYMKDLEKFLENSELAPID